jgi:hypothetical protein
MAICDELISINQKCTANSMMNRKNNYLKISAGVYPLGAEITN